MSFLLSLLLSPVLIKGLLFKLDEKERIMLVTGGETDLLRKDCGVLTMFTMLQPTKKEARHFESVFF